MSAIPKPAPVPRRAAELHSGDRMTRAEFHRIYETMPEDFKAELVGGIVYVAPPLGLPHGTSHPFLSAALTAYAGHTPGVQVGDNTTILLGEEGEPQPDLFLRILPEFGGQSETIRDPRTNEAEYVSGAPELIAEIAHSSYAIDLHAKREDYRRYGVLEYLVLSLKENQLRWIDLRTNRELAADADGIIRTRTFPGLWIDSAAVLGRDFQRLMAAVNQGLATVEHRDFMNRLAAARGELPNP